MVVEDFSGPIRRLFEENDYGAALLKMCMKKLKCDIRHESRRGRT